MRQLIGILEDKHSGRYSYLKINFTLSLKKSVSPPILALIKDGEFDKADVNGEKRLDTNPRKSRQR